MPLNKRALDGEGTSSFLSQNTLGPVSGFGLLLMPAFALGTWDSPGLFDVALFKHSDHPVKLQLMDRACHSERPRQRGDNLVTRTHLSFVVERDILCTGALVSTVLVRTLCELQCSQSCHLGLNNPRCHYLVHLSVSAHTDQTIHSSFVSAYVCVLYIV